MFALLRGEKSTAALECKTAQVFSRGFLVFGKAARGKVCLDKLRALIT
jgi:hypothetical protein